MPTRFQLSLGHEVRERRKERNLSQEELAARAGIHTNVVGRLERAEHDVRVTTLYAVARKLNMSLADLCAGAEKRLRLGLSL